MGLACPLAGQAAEPAPEAPDSALHIDVEWGVGYGAQKATLFQVTPESTVVYLDGVQRLAGSHLRARVQLDWTLPLEQGRGLNLQADLQGKRGNANRDLDFYAASLQPMWSMPLDASSVGVGLSLQTTGVAGAAFRDTRGLTANWTLARGDGLWAVIGETSRYRHHAGFAELDAQARSLLGLRRWDRPWQGVDSAQLSLIAGRERNRRGLPELSQRSLLLSAALDGHWGTTDWTLRLSHLRARFDGTAFVAQAQRSDRMAMVDAVLAWPLGEGQQLRLEANLMGNRSTVRLFQNRYRQWSLSWSRRLS
jgi:hypothetical protein